MPLTVPKTSDLNLTPTSTELASPESADAGVVPDHSEHGQPTLTVVPLPGVPTFALSSVARALMFAVGLPWAVHEYVQIVVPVAGCHVLPPSVETSTPATTPPASLAVPVIVVVAPSWRLAPFAGDVMVAVGAVLSVDLLATLSPSAGSSANGCTPMSAKRLTVACCMLLSSGVPEGRVLL